MHRPPCEPIQSYLAEIEAMSERYGVANVFVASDDQKAVEAVTALPGIRCLNTLDPTPFT